MPLSKKAFSVLLANSGLEEVKYINRIIIYREIGIVKITIYSIKFNVGSKRENFNIT